MSRRYIVEVYRPAYPQRGLRFRAHRWATYRVDHLTPTMFAVRIVDAPSAKAAIREVKRGFRYV